MIILENYVHTDAYILCVSLCDTNMYLWWVNIDVNASFGGLWASIDKA